MDNIDELTHKMMRLREVDPQEFNLIINYMTNTIQINQMKHFTSNITDIIQTHNDELKKIEL